MHSKEGLHRQGKAAGQRSQYNPGDSPPFATVSGFLGPRVYVPRSEDTQRSWQKGSEQ